jgi:arylsulfatase
LIDIMATCVDVAGTEYPGTYKGHQIQPMEGVSLAPTFEDKPLRERAIYWEHEGNRAIRQGKWKLVSKHPGGWELYDMENDRTELNDLAATHPDKVKELKSLYEAWARRCGVRPWPLKKKP